MSRIADKKILIADDEQRMRKLVGDFFRKEGFHVIEVQNGKEVLEFYKEKFNFDLVILDVMMPEYDGWTVCREIRKASQVPIIMLTAKSEEFDELLGFEVGADEYITKPFSPKILVARAKALLRRMEDKSIEDIKIYGVLKIDEIARAVFIDDQEIELSPKEYELLLYLVMNKGKALSRDQILNGVWGFDYFGDLRTVDTHINRLRIKLKNVSNFVQTVRGYGYKFEVEK